MNKNQNEIKHIPPKKNLGDLFLKNSSGYFEIYCICVNDKEMPLLCQQLVLIYTEYEEACRVAKSFSDSYEENTIQVAKITDVNAFFTKMWASILKCFIVNGEGAPHYFADYCSKPINNKIVEEMNISEEIKIAQPKKIVASKNKSLFKGNDLFYRIKKLPLIHRERLLIAYLFGVISIIISICYLIFAEDDSNLLIAPSFILTLSGIINAFKVSDKLKLKNPPMAIMARLSLLLYLIQVVIYIIKFKVVGF